MNLKNNIVAFYFIIVLLIILGIYLINRGDLGMGRAHIRSTRSICR